MLMVAFRTPSGIPYGTLNFRSLSAYNPAWANGASGLSEFGTEQARLSATLCPICMPP